MNAKEHQVRPIIFARRDLAAPCSAVVGRSPRCARKIKKNASFTLQWAIRCSQRRAQSCEINIGKGETLLSGEILDLVKIP